MNDGHVLYMGNPSTSIVKVKENIKIEFTSINFITLGDVYHVLEIKNNLVCGSFLNKFEFKLIFESDTFMLTKKDNFVS